MELSDKQVLITGGTGFLGKHLCAAVERAGGVVSLSSSKQYDLRDSDAAHELVEKSGADVVIHLAAKCGGIGANRDAPMTFFTENMLMGINVISSCVDYKIKKLVFVGTTCSYPKFTVPPFNEAQLFNGFPEETNAPYGIAKRALFVLCDAARQQHGLHSIKLIPANLYGPGDHFDLEKSHVIPAIIQKMDEARVRGDDDVELWGDGTPTREFLFVKDCAEGIVASAARYDGTDHMNLGTNKEISIRELSETIAKSVGYEGALTWNTEKPNGQPRRSLDVGKAARDIGWVAKTRFEEGIRQTIDWYRDNVR